MNSYAPYSDRCITMNASITVFSVDDPLFLITIRETLFQINIGYLNIMHIFIILGRM